MPKPQRHRMSVDGPKQTIKNGESSSFLANLPNRIAYRSEACHWPGCGDVRILVVSPHNENVDLMGKI